LLINDKLLPLTQYHNGSLLILAVFNPLNSHMTLKPRRKVKHITCILLAGLILDTHKFLENGRGYQVIDGIFGAHFA
jgi:hypothetical protein